jgi:hypothetical protein
MMLANKLLSDILYGLLNEALKARDKELLKRLGSWVQKFRVSTFQAGGVNFSTLT